MTLTREQIRQLTPEQVEQLLVDAQAVHKDIVDGALAEQRYNDTAVSVHAFENPGDAWVLPISKAHGYPKGAVRTREGVKYISTDFANVTVPGTPGAEWSVVTGEHPEWAKSMLYDKGLMVIHQGIVYASMRNRNATEPGTKAGRLHWSVAEGETPPLGEGPGA